MLEVLQYLRANGYRTYIVTDGGQDFARMGSERVYRIAPEQVVGTASDTKFDYDKDGKPILTREPKLMLFDDFGGKSEGIHLMIGRRPTAAFGDSTGNQQMLEYTGAGDGARLMMLLLHDDAKREYAYGPAMGLPDTKVGTFTQALYDEAKKKAWTVISMKNIGSAYFRSNSLPHIDQEAVNEEATLDHPWFARGGGLGHSGNFVRHFPGADDDLRRHGAQLS
jgi:hypothetical protein